MKKMIILLLILLGIAAFLYSGLGSELSFENLKARQAEFSAMAIERPALVLGGFFLLYVAVTALSLPGAAILTLAAGALFGLFTGTIIVSFASTIGATLAFLSSRFLLRDWVVGKFGDRLKAINEGVEKDGAFYLFTLRLVPLFPFFVINLLMGLTPIRTWTYYWVSQIGMLLGTLVYVNAGTQLARINSMADIASPVLIGSFVALGLLPWVGKWLIQRLRPAVSA